MKTAIIYGPENVRAEEVDIPAVGPDDVLVQVKASGICGSDVHRYLGTAYGRKCNYPVNSGHEYCGDVIEVGNRVKNFRAGEKVTLGVSWAGGGLGAFSEYVHIPDADNGLRKLPREISYTNGALIEPFLIAMNSYHRPNPTPDDRVLILGAGTIGLCVLLLCRAKGIEDIIVNEPSPTRRQAAEQAGAKTVNTADEDLEETVMSSTQGKGADVTFECAGAEETLNQAFALTRNNGRISLIAHYQSTPQFNIETLIVKSLNAFGPLSGHAFFDAAVELVTEGMIDLTPLVSHQYPLEEADKAFETAVDVDHSVKVLFNP